MAGRGLGAGARGLGAAWANKPIRYGGMTAGGLYGVGKLLGGLDEATEQGQAAPAGTAAEQAQRLEQTRNVFGGR